MFVHEFQSYLFQSFFFLTINATITNPTRGWPHLGLPTLLTAGERSKGKGKSKTQAGRTFMHMCVRLTTLILPQIICNLPIYPSIVR